MQRVVIAATHRADIQGLRAVAVVAVLLFHIGGWAGGGYTGVDVFFVISGYVISMAYLEKFIRAPNVPTVLDFFQRRLLRLAPALIVVTAVTLVLTDVLLPPTENKLFAIEAGLAAMMQTSNVYFSHLGTNYWLDNLSRNPFLHTWSLGVEWQFYAIFPLSFLAGGLARRFFGGSYGVVAVGALAIALAGSYWLFLASDATSAFYGPWSRFWQFALGISAYLATRRWGVAQVSGPLSLGLLIGIFALAMLPPVILPQTAGSTLASLLTAALLFAAPSRSLSGRLLTSSMFQSVGYASYSIYLTHWPVAVFGRLLLGEGFLCDVLLFALSLATGFLLSRSVEYRLVHAAHPSRAALACAAVVAIACVGFAERRAVLKLPWYAAPPLVAHVDGYHNFWWTDIDGAKDNFRHSAQFKAGDLYRHPVAGTDVQEAVAARGSHSRWIVGVGNSYIESSGAMLRRYALDKDVSLALYHIANCSTENESRCVRGFEYVAESLEAKKDRIEIIYIAFRGLEGAQSLTRKSVARLLSRLDHAGLRVVIQGPSPVYRYDPHACLSLLQPCPPTEMLPVDVAMLKASEHRLANMFPSGPQLTIWSPYKDLCTDEACLVRENGASLVMDTDHFSNAGQRYLYPYLREALASALSSR